MTWIRRILLASPFVVAAVLTVLSRFADRVHLNLQRIAGYCFLFGAPCGWLLGRDGFGGAHGRWMQLLIDGAVIPWIPRCSIQVVFGSCFVFSDLGHAAFRGRTLRLNLEKPATLPSYTSPVSLPRRRTSGTH